MMSEDKYDAMFEAADEEARQAGTGNTGSGGLELEEMPGDDDDTYPCSPTPKEAPPVLSKEESILALRKKWPDKHSQLVESAFCGLCAAWGDDDTVPQTSVDLADMMLQHLANEKLLGNR